MTQLTPLQRAGHALTIVVVGIYIAAMFVLPNTKFSAIVHTVTLYAFGAVIAGACALLLYISGRAVITGKL